MFNGPRPPALEDATGHLDGEEACRSVPMVQVRGVSPPEEIAIAMQQKEIAAQYMQAQRFRAEAKKIVMEAIGAGAKKMDDRAIMYLYLKALQEISKGSSTNSNCTSSCPAAL